MQPARSLPQPGSVPSTLARVAVTVSGALVVAVVLGWAGLLLVRVPVLLVDEPGGHAVVGLALLPTAVLALAGTVGSLLAIASAAVLVRQRLSGSRSSLTSAWRRAWRALPAMVGLAALAVVGAGASGRLWWATAVVALLWAGVRARRGGRSAGLRALWLAVPFAVPAALLVAIPVMWAGLVCGAPVRDVARRAVHQRLVARGAVLLGTAPVLGAGWLLGRTGRSLLAGPDATLGRTGLGLLGLMGCLAAALAVAGAALGWLAHRRGEDTPLPAATPDRRQAGGRRGLWTPARLASVATVTVVALVAPMAPGLLVLAGGAASAVAPVLPGGLPTSVQGPGDAGLVVTTLADTLPVPGECVDAGSSCGVRAAVAEAASRGGDVVDFDVTGTIDLLDTLVLAPGVVLDGTRDGVVLDAHGAFRAVRAEGDPEAEGGQVVLRGLEVTGGRSAAGGAGLSSDGPSVSLEDMVFVDNVTTGGDGGAVAGRSVRATTSTFHDNHAPAGSGGAVAARQVVLVNSTLVGNTASTRAGGAVLGDGELVHVTVVGGGVAGSADGFGLSVVNSAVSVNDSDVACARLSEAMTPGETGNVDPDGTCEGTTAAPGPFGPLELADGDLTPVLVPGPEAGVLLAATADRCEYADQRGVGRVASVCDAGAVQVSTETAPELELTLTSTPEVVRPGDAVDLVLAVSPDTPVGGGWVEFLGPDGSLGDPVRLDADQTARFRVFGLAQGPHLVRARLTVDGSSTPVTSQDLTVRVRQQVLPQLSAPRPTVLHAPTVLTASLVIDDEPDVPLPTGTMRFENGGVTHEVDVVDGIAQWHVDDLPASFVRLTYLGDDFHEDSRWEEYVTTQDLPTTTTATVVDSRVRLGEPAVVDVESRGERWPAQGTVQVTYDGRLVQARLVDGRARLEVPLGVGSHRLSAVLRPDNGWASSTSEEVSVEVAPAATTVTLDAPTARTWDDPDFMVSAHVGGAGRAGAEVRLLDGTTVLDSRTTDAGGDVEWRVGQTVLDAGEHALRAEVVGSASTESVRSDLTRLVVARARSEVSATAEPVAWREAATVVVTSVAGARTGLLVLRDRDDTVVGTGTMTDGAGTVTFTAEAPGALDLRVHFSPTDGNHEGTSAVVRVVVERLVPAAPLLQWSPDARPGAAFLSVHLPDTDPVPSGVVELHDRQTGRVLDSATLSSGDASLDLPLAHACFCNRLEVRYSGDDLHRPAEWIAPDLELGPFPSSTAWLDLPEQVESGTALRLTAAVSSAGGTDGEVVFRVNGDVVATRPVQQGRASADVPVAGPGPRAVRADFRPSSSDVAASTVSGTVTVTPQPGPVVTIREVAPLAFGSSGYLQLSSMPSRRPYPSAVVIRDDLGVEVGVASWPTYGWDLMVKVTPSHAGATTFTAEYLYADPGGQLFEATSAPFATTVASFPTLMRLSTTRTPTVGGPVDLTLDLQTPEVLRPHAGMELQLLADGVVQGPPQQLLPGVRRASWLLQATRTSTTYEVVTTGDGRDYRAGRTGLSVWADPLVPTVSAAPSGSISYGDTWRARFSLAGPNHVAAPTGTVTLRVLDPYGFERASCTVRAERAADGSCDLPARSMPAGSYLTVVEYSGDDRFQPVSSQRGTLQVAAVGSSLRTTLTSRGSWLVGSDQVASWTVSDPLGSAGAPTGTVRVDLQSDGEGTRTLCQGPAAAGRCAFEVPGSREPLAQQRRRVVATYVPTSDALVSSEDLGLVATPRCLQVNARTDGTPTGERVPAPRLAGRSCRVGGTDGFVEGTDVDISAGGPAPANYRFVGFYVQTAGGSALRREETLTMRVDGYVAVFSEVEWAPDCVTLYTATEDFLRPNDGEPYRRSVRTRGLLDVLTEPNCTDPRRTSAAESEQLRTQGYGRYARGTTIRVVPRAAYPRHLPSGAPDPAAYEYEAVGVVGATKVPEERVVWSTVLTDDQTTLRPQFRMTSTMCLPLPLSAGAGGTIQVRSASVPAGPDHAFEDRLGRCRQPGGAPGFLRGTNLELQAVAGPGNYVHAWVDGNQPQPLVGAGSLPVDARRSVTVGRSGASTAEFAFVDCVSVDYNFWIPVQSDGTPRFLGTQRVGGGPLPDGMPGVDALLQPGNCPIRPSTQSDQVALKGTAYTNLTRTGRRWFVRGTRLTSEAPTHAMDQYHPGEFYLTGARVFGGTYNPFYVSELLTQDTQMTVRYRGVSCRPANVVSRPARYPFTVLGGEDARCPAGLVIGGGISGVQADGGGGRGYPNKDGLLPFISVTDDATRIDEMFPESRRPWDANISDAASRRTLTVQTDRLDWEGRSEGSQVRIDYCARLDVELRFEKADGSWLDTWQPWANGLPRSADRVLTDGDSCLAPLMAIPGARAQIGLSSAGATYWRMVRSEVGGRVLSAGERPWAGVDADGRANTPRVVVTVAPRCFSLSTPKSVRVTIAPNCPGEAGRYIAGTQVGMTVQEYAQADTHSWGGVAASQGFQAVVVMHGDRAVTTDYRDPSVLEIVVTVASNFVQRAAAALLGFAASIAGTVLFVMDALAFAVDGLAWVLDKVGLDGAVVDGLRTAGATIQASSDLAKSLGTCAAEHVTGGGSTLAVPNATGQRGLDVGVGAAGYALEWADQAGAAGALGNAADLVSVTDLFLTGADGWLRSPEDAWGSVGDIGGCIQEKGEEVGHATGLTRP